MSLWEEVGEVGVQTCFAAQSYYQTLPSSPSSGLPVVPACKGKREEDKGEKEKREEEGEGGREGEREGGREGGREREREGGRERGREGGKAQFNRGLAN